MTDNEYRPKEDKAEEKVTLDNNKKSKKVQDDSKFTLKNPMDTLMNRFDKKKMKTISGALMTLLSIFLFAACFSYLFTWSIDQDRVLNKGMFEFLFEQNAIFFYF